MTHRPSPRTAGRTACSLALALLVAPLPATAQRLVLSYSPGGAFTPPFTQALDVRSGRIEWSKPVLTDTNAVVTADGRYFARRTTSSGSTQLQVTDAATGTVTDVPLDFDPRLAHPRRLEFYGLTAVSLVGGVLAGTVARLDLGGVHPYAACGSGGARDVDLTVGGASLLALCASGDLAVMDAATGVVQRIVLAGAAADATTVRVDAGGARVLVTRGGAAAGVALLDLVSGATLGSTVFPDPNPYPGSTPCLSGQIVGASPDRRVVAVTCSWFASSNPPGGPSSFSARTRLLDVATLTWGLDLGILYRPTTVVFSPDGRTAFAHSVHPRGFSAFQSIDTGTGTTLAEYAGMTFSLAAAFAPLAPTLSATVAGARLDLMWTLPSHSPAATSYVVEGGTTPGLTDIGTVAVGPGQTLSLPGVPPGTYFVRVRAVNATGLGTASNEVTITIP